MEKSKNNIYENLNRDIKAGILKMLYSENLINNFQFNELLKRLYIKN